MAANPDDDLPRLVFADWLEEQSRPADRARGLFIRGQIALEKMNRESPAYPWAYFDLFSRVCAAADGFVREWLKELPPLVAQELKRERLSVDLFRRGFVERVRLPPKTFTAHARHLFEVAPVTEAHLLLDANTASQVFTCPELRHLRAVRFSRQAGWSRPWGIASLAKCRYLRSLRELDLSSCGLDDRDAQFLSRTTELPALETLNLQHNRLTYSGVVALAQTTDLQHVRRSDLRGNGRLDDWRRELKRWYGDRLVF